MAASVSFFRSLAGISQLLPRTAPTLSAASAIIASEGWVYLRVVWGSAWPSSLPMASTVAPVLSAMLAWVWRRS